MTFPDSGPAYEEAAEMIEQYRASAPDVAAAFLQMLDRIRDDAAWAGVTATMQQVAGDNSISAILRRQARAMDKVRSAPQKFTLLPDFTGSNWSRLEKAVIDLLPSTVEEVYEIENAVAEAGANLANRTLINKIAERLPGKSEIADKAPLVGFYAVSAYLIKMSPDLNANTIAVLGILVAVWAVLVQRPKP